MDRFDDVRAIAPTSDVDAAALHRARRALDQEIGRSAWAAPVGREAKSATTPSPVRRRVWLGALTAISAVVLVAGVVTGAALAGLWRLPTPSTPVAPIATATEAPSDDRMYLCHGSEVPGAVLQSPRYADEVDPGVQAMLASLGDEGLTDVGPWIVVSEAKDVVVVVRSARFADANLVQQPLVDHQLVIVDRLEPDGPWTTQNSMCMLALDLGELRAPAVQVDPAHPLDPSSRDVHLLLTEEDCAGGGEATGRIELVSLEETSERVGVVLGIRPLGAATCPSNPPTPYVLRLAEPLGDRTVVNEALVDQPLIPVAAEPQPVP